MRKRIKQANRYDLIVIGSGIAGSNSALLAAQAKLKVALIEANKLGGASANFSDVPVGVFSEAAKSFEQAKRASSLGLRADTIGYNFPSIRAFKNKSIDTTKVTAPEFYEQSGIDLIIGRAQFINPKTISVNGQHLIADKFIVATGSEWKLPKIAGLDKINYQTPETMINTSRPPRSLFVIGGNRAGIEVGQIMATFGTKVYITEIASRLLPELDEDVGDWLETHLVESLNMIISTSSRVTSIRKDGLNYRVKFSHAGVDQEVAVEEVLLAMDRLPSTDLGLENAAINYNSDGILTNQFLQTNNKNIFAVGSVLGPKHSNSHTAIAESQAVISNLLRLAKKTINYQIMPDIIRTNPTIATIGLSEDDCTRQSLDFRSSLCRLTEAPYGLISPNKIGFIKLIVNNRKVLIGATIVADQAETLIHELQLALIHQMTARELAELPHAFLSPNEIISIAAAKLI